MVGQVMPANQVPLVVLPVETSGDPPATPKRMDIGGTGPPSPMGWPKAEQEQVRELLLIW